MGISSNTFLKSLTVLQLSFPFNFVENLHYFYLDQLNNHQIVYKPLHQAPYPFYAYPPLYTWFGYVVQQILGVSKIFALRLVTLLAEIGIVITTLGWLRNRFSSWYAYLFSGLLGVLLVAHEFHGLARVDMLLVWFQLLSLMCLLGLIEKKTPLLITGLVIGSVLSVLTKQTAIVQVGFLMVMVLLFIRPFSFAIKIVSLVSLSVLAVLWGTLLLLGDDTFNHLFIYHQALSTNLTDGFMIICKFLLKYGVLLATFLYMIIKSNKRDPLTLIFGFNMVFFLMSNLKDGADSNYELLPLVLLILTIATNGVPFLPRLLSLLSLKIVKWSLFMVIFLPVLLGNTTWFWIHYSVDNQYYQLLSQVVEQSSRPLSEYGMISLLAGKEAEHIDLFTNLALSKHDSGFRSEFIRGFSEKYDLVIAGPRIQADSELMGILESRFSRDNTLEDMGFSSIFKVYILNQDSVPSSTNVSLN